MTSFRINAKRFHLTWAGLHVQEIHHTDVLTLFRELGASHGRLVEYVIGREPHTNPTDPDKPEHYHAFVVVACKINVRDWRITKVFDLKGCDGRTLHPEVQAVGRTARDRERVIRYDMKKNDYIAALETPLPELVADCEEADADGGQAERHWARQVAAAPTVRAGMDLLFETRPDLYLLNGVRIQQMLGQRVGDGRATFFSLDDFRSMPLNLTTPIVLHGLSGAGKTEFALAHFDNAHVCRRRDDLKRITHTTDGLVFDDMTFSKWEPEDVIALLSWDKHRTIACRYHDAQIPADLPMIFTTNLSMTNAATSIFPAGRNAEQQTAIDRRYSKVAITEPLQKLGRAFTPAEMARRRTTPTERVAPGDAPQAAEDDDVQEEPAERRQRRRLRRIVCSDSEDAE